MTYQDCINNGTQRMDKTISVLRQELSSLKAGRANPQILDRVLVDYYGTPTPITQMGNVSAPEPRVLVINLWEASMIKEVEKAITQSDLGINPSNDGKVIRLVVPELTQERRKELTKVVSKLGEEARIAIRAIRRDLNEQLKKAEKKGEITEDELTRGEKEVQKTTDKYVKTIDEMVQAKEKEIMSV